MDNTPFWRRPYVQVGLGIVVFLVVYFILIDLLGGWMASVSQIFTDGLLCVGAFVLWLIFFAQFILPVRSISDRLKLLERIAFYFIPKFLTFGQFEFHGPAIFIKDGKIIQKITQKGNRTEKEALVGGPGVIWLDTASAAVLRNPVRFTRAVGPGVVFTEWKETIAGVVDLHTQRHSLGPDEGEDPFASQPEEMSKEKYKESQDRTRWSTSGMTRDGIEVVARISVVFKIDADEEKHEGNTFFGFNHEAVFKAIANEGVNPGAKKDSLDFYVSWNELPAPIAVDVWREYLRKFTLSQLFDLLPPSGDGNSSNGQETALQFIVRMVNERLKQPNSTALDDFGRTTGEKKSSREYQLLMDSGIKIIKVSIKRLFFAPSIEEQLVRQWTANWLKTARREREQVEQKRSLSSLIGQGDALKEYAIQASQEISKKPPKDAKTGLELLLQDTLKSIVRNTSLYRRLSSEPHEITELIQWLRENA